MDPATDLIEHFRLDVVLFPDHTRHTFYHSDGRQNRRKVKVVKTWIKQQELGEGGGGTVWLEKDSNGDERAVKQISKAFCLRNRIDYRKEITAMARLTKHPELFVELHGWFDDDTKVFLAMEYFKHGDLQNFMDSPLPERDVGIITRQLLEGLNVMHKHGFTHRDLKRQNIFVVAELPTWWVKIGDFGIAKRIMDDQTALRTEVGTRDYQAPEVFGFTDSEEELCYTSAVDLWALGCVMYRLLTLEKPFPKPSSLRLYCYSMRGFPVEPLYAKDVSENAVEFIRQLMRPHPPERLDAETALKSDWHGLQDSNSDSKPDSIAEEKAAAEVPVRKGNTLPAQATVTTLCSTDNRSGIEKDTPSGSSSEVSVVRHALQSEHVVKRQRARLQLKVLHKNWPSEVDFEQEWSLPESKFDGLDDTDVSHENHIASNVDTLNLVTKAGTASILRTMSQARKKNGMAEAKSLHEDRMKDQREPIGEDSQVEWDGLRRRETTTSSQGSLERRGTLHPPLKMSAYPDVDEFEDTMNQCSTLYTFQQIIDQEEGLEEHPDRPACPRTSESDTTLDEAEILTSTKAICPTCYFEGGPKRPTLLAKSMAAIVYCEKHKYMVEQDTATLKQLHRAGYFLDVRTISADLSTERDATKALHWAAKSECFRALKYLLDRGVHPCAIDREQRWQQRTALHYATYGGFAKEVAVLIERGADVKALDSKSWTPLHYAARGGFHAISEALLKAGASVHSLNSFLETPLHCAARNEHNEVFKLLLDWGADASAKDMERYTPFTRARQTKSKARNKGFQGFCAPILGRAATRNGTKALSE